MPKFVDDELDELPIKHTASTVSSTKPSAKEHLEEDELPVTPKATKATAKVVEDDESDEGVTSVKFGDQKLMAKGDGLNRIRAEKNKVVRFALLPFLDPLTTHSHFVDAKDKKGTFRCLIPKEGETPFCCAKLEEEGMLHVVSLAIQYTNADTKTGSYEKGTPIEWEIGYVDFSRSNFRAVSNLAPEDSSVYDIDIVMSKKDSGIGYEFVLRANKAKWKMNPELAEEVEAAAQKFVKDGGKKLRGKLGRKLSLMEWRTLLAGQTSGAEASLDDVDDL
jgi:hypothetical protein